MAWAIRRGVAADAAVIAEFNRLMALESEGKALDPAVVAAGVAAGLADPHKGLYFLAEEDGRVLGQAMISPEWSDWRNGWIWWFQSVYVRPEARRSGVFRGLYEHVYQTARAADDVVGLRLYVARDNWAAQETYVRLGMAQANYLVFERCPL
ncbi:MAG TPA: GNAT family N-acetyltransferase [Gemmataceae bacterium]|jgi:GNAT superfamily N-acetyltransferase|nr:GNAT family N-acetyltransferase [Gemmataceae bacterium]